jgi:hypothetical protein
MYNSKNIIHCEFCFFTFLISVLPKTKYYRRKRLEKQAQEVTIIRDNGVYHIFMVKQMLMPYLDYSMRNVNDFKRVELNYIEKLGRLAEIKGNLFCITI